jgi:uncharacterized membrane protein YjgN (DUF898 family)
MDDKKPFVFTGTGSEYFRIWIVNLLLTILTFGIYSAWAKVRRLQYFYRNTWLNEVNFDYHGDPTAILKGRVLAVILLSVYNLSGGLSPILGLIFLIPLMLVMPVLLYKSLRFRAINSSYSGLRFGFSARLPETCGRYWRCSRCSRWCRPPITGCGISSTETPASVPAVSASMPVSAVSMRFTARRCC